jgi:hypothetical protein
MYENQNVHSRKAWPFLHCPKTLKLQVQDDIIPHATTILISITLVSNLIGYFVSG